MKEVSEFSKWLIYKHTLLKAIRQTTPYKQDYWLGSMLFDKWYGNTMFIRYLQNRFELHWN